MADALRVPSESRLQSPSAAEAARQVTIPMATARSGTRQRSKTVRASQPSGTAVAMARRTVTPAAATKSAAPPGVSGGAPSPISRFASSAVPEKAASCAMARASRWRGAGGTCQPVPVPRDRSQPAAAAAMVTGTKRRSAETMESAGPPSGKSTRKERNRYSTTSAPAGQAHRQATRVIDASP